MPCTDGGVPYPPSKEEILERKTGAMLCAIWSALPDYMRITVRRTANWKEAGVTDADFCNWWRKHGAQDKRRLDAEAREAALRAAYESAKSKLSPEELAAVRRVRED